MISNQPSSDQFDQNLQSTGTAQSMQPSADVHLPSASAPIQTPNQSSTTQQQPTLQSSQSQSPQSSSSKGTNSRLNRILLGGLIGGTLGSLAAALASRRTSEGFNRATQGTQSAFKTIGMGLGQAAKGVGDAAKSIGGGIGYAIAGNAQDTAEGIVQGAQQIGDATASAVQSTTEGLSSAGQQIGQQISDQVGAASQSFSQSAQSSMGSGSQVAGSDMEQSDLLSEDQGEADLIAAVILQTMETGSLEGESSLPDMIIVQEETPQILLQDNPFSDPLSDAESAGSREYFSE